MSGTWGGSYPEWITPESVLADWRGRIERLAENEAARIMVLPFVREVAVIGSVGRGAPWPLSDVDLMTLAEPWHGRKPNDLLAEHEAERAKALLGAHIPNEVELRYWALLPERTAPETTGSDAVFVRSVSHPYHMGFVLKAQGGRVLHDEDGRLAGFVEACERVIFGADYLRLWLGNALKESREALARASALTGEGRTREASAQLIVGAHEASTGLYARWQQVPQSIMRGVTRLCAAAERAGEPELLERFLIAARLTEADIRVRVADVPEQGMRELATLLAIRRGSGEDVGGLDVARDLLHAKTYLDCRRRDGRPLDDWTGTGGSADDLRAQAGALQDLMDALQEATDV